MTGKKNRLFTFLFSLCPGAGEMYMGFMKQGISLMGVFCLLIFLASWFNMGELLFVLPVLWFYSFFHVHNLKNLSDEEFYALEDDYLFHLEHILPEGESMDKRTKKVVAFILIVVGVLFLSDNINDTLGWLLPSYRDHVYWIVINKFPRFLVAVFLIWSGVSLIRGKKRELDTQVQESKEKDTAEWEKEEMEKPQQEKEGERL